MLLFSLFFIFLVCWFWGKSLLGSFSGKESLIACLLAVILLPQGVQGQEEFIWVGLVEANSSPPTENPFLKKIEPRLKSVFGFNAYHLIGSAKIPLNERWEQWILPRKDFYMKIIPLESEEDSPFIHFELYRNKTPLVNGRFHITQERPVFINGPHCGSTGRLIFLLHLMKGDKL